MKGEGVLAGAIIGLAESVYVLDAVSVGPPGHAVRVQWAEVPGATAVEVTEATLAVAGVWAEDPLGELSVTGAGEHRTLSVPAGTRLRAATLKDLKRDGETDVLRTEADLGEQRALVVALPDGTVLHTAPAGPARGALPATLTGATFDGGVLTVPDLNGPQLRVSLAEHPAGERFPEKMSFVPFSVGTVTGRCVRAPRDLALTGPDGTPVWAWPGELLPAVPVASVDFRVPLQSALEAAQAAGQPTDITFRLAGAAPATALVSAPSVTGAILRQVTGVQAVALEGDGVALDTGPVPLAAEQPSAVTASVGLTYDGFRLLETVNDAVPGAAGGAAGPVVGDAPVLRALPPGALASAPPVARVGVVGRAPVACELSIEVVDLTGGPPGVPVAAPGVVVVAPSAAITTIWADVAVPPAGAAGGVPLGVSVRATSGRFLWASGPSAGAASLPLVRIVVRDPDPGGRRVHLGAATLATMTESAVPVSDVSLPAAAFRTAPPVLSSDLFVTVEVADLVLRYGR